MNNQLLGNKALKTNIDKLTVTGSHALHLLVLESIAYRISEHGDSEMARYYFIALKQGMVGKPAGLSAKSFATELKRIGGKLQQDDKGTIKLSGIKKGSQMNLDFFKDSAPKKAEQKTNAEKLAAYLEKITSAKDDQLSVDDVITIVSKQFDINLTIAVSKAA